MTWMITASGATLDLRFVRCGDIAIDDIAHHLAQENRFCGAARRPYSVAEHSLLVCDLVEHAAPGARSPTLLLAALLHDAHEAYCKDLHSPMKQVLGEAWRREERRMQLAVLKRFHISTAFAGGYQLIHWADMTALAIERRDLLPRDIEPWPCLEPFPAPSEFNVLGRERFTWADWRQAYLDRYGELQYAIALQVQQLGQQG